MFFWTKNSNSKNNSSKVPQNNSLGVDIGVKVQNSPEPQNQFLAGREDLDLEAMQTKQNTKTKRKIGRRGLFLIGIFILVIFAWFGGSIAGNIYKIFGGSSPSLLSFIKGFSPGNVIDGEKENRVNILILGRGGPGHPGGDLTDTIIIASLDVKKKEIALLSIPRDMYVEYPDSQGYGRINAVYNLGVRKANTLKYQTAPSKSDKELNGATYARDFISDVLDIPVHYYADIDFQGFVKVIDEVGGVTVDVEETIYDPYFPDTRLKGYDPFYIKAGVQTLNGTKALKYARSRKTTSDFDRAKRQQKVLVALKTEIEKLNIVRDAKKIYDTIKIVGDHLKTDMETWEMQRLWQLLEDVDIDNPKLAVIDNSADGALLAQSINGASVLVPRLGIGNYSEIRGIVANLFSSVDADQKNALLAEKKLVKIEVWNGTNTVGLASSTKTILVQDGYNVVKVGNAPASNYTNSQVIDYTGGKYPATLDALKSKFRGVLLSQGGKLTSGADILVILGASYKQ
jgi:LCP family protein required for cell wall assembly